MEQASRTDVSSEWLLLHDGSRDTWILLATVWSSQACPPAPFVSACAPPEPELCDATDGLPYVLPALIFFWFASFAWGLWYIAHAA
jgi:hypothetical protein